MYVCFLGWVCGWMEPLSERRFEDTCLETNIEKERLWKEEGIVKIQKFT